MTDTPLLRPALAAGADAASDGTTPDTSQAAPAASSAPAATPAAAPTGSGILAGLPPEVVLPFFMNHWINNTAAPPAGSVGAAKAAAAPKPTVDRPVSSDDSAPEPVSPGSFADKLKGAMGNIGAEIGDAAHAHDTRGGWLSGVTNVLNARQQRLAQEKKDAALLAKTQADTVLLHKNAFKQDMEIQDALVKHNDDYVSTLKTNHNVEAGVTHAAVVQRMQSDKDFAQNYEVRQTGIEPVITADGTPKKDKDGNPVTSPTYTVIERRTKDGQPDNITLSADEAAKYKKFGLADLPANTKLTQGQYGALNVKLGLVSQGVNILEMANGDKKFTDDQLKQIAPYIDDETVLAAISHVPGSPYAGMKQFLDNADAHIQQAQQQADAARKAGNQGALDAANAQIDNIQRERNKVATIMPQVITQKQVDDYEKKNGDSFDEIKDLQKKTNSAHGAEAAAIAESTQGMLNKKDSNYTPAQRAMLTNIHDQAAAAAKASSDYELNLERKKKEVQQAIADGDDNTLVNAALDYDLDPDTFSKRNNSNAHFKQMVFDEAKKRGMHWDDNTYKIRYQMKKEVNDDKPNSIGAGKQSLNTFLGHVDEANDFIIQVPNTPSSWINKPLNEIRKQFGNDKVQPYMLNLNNARTEYLNFLNNNHALTEHDKQLGDKLVSEDTAPTAAQAILREMVKTAAVRARAMNGRYQTAMGGGNIPGLILPENETVMRNFGVDPQEAYKGRAVAPKNPNPNNPPSGAKSPTAGKAADNTPVWQMNDGTIQDAAGNKYDPNTGKRL